MSRHVAILRRGKELDSASEKLSSLERALESSNQSRNSNAALSSVLVRRWGEARNLLLVARLVTIAALRREESRGAHYRDDFPLPRAEWRRQQSMTVKALLDTH